MSGSSLVLPGLAMAGQHSAESAEWYSPPEIVERGREYAGGKYHLDPASCAIANTIIRAERYYTIHDNGLAQPWVIAPAGERLSVWHNPPTPAEEWWVRFSSTLVACDGIGVYVAYSIEQLSQSLGWGGFPMLDFSVCILGPVGDAYSRTRYMTTAGQRIAVIQRRAEPVPAQGKRKAKPGRALKPEELAELGKLDKLPPDTLVRGDSPPHASAIVGIGGDHALFEKLFRDVGGVVRGARVK